MQIKTQLIVLSNNGTILHTEKHDIKQFENNFEYLILCNVFQGEQKGTISLSFSDEYPLQYATLRKLPYTYDGQEWDAYGWRGIQDLTLDAPRTISLSILADDYDNNIFSTLPITYNCIQSLQYNEVVGDPNSVESLSYELNNAIADIQQINSNIDGIVNGGIIVDSANKDALGNVIHETYATIETVDALTDRVTTNEADIDALELEQTVQNNRLDAIEGTQTNHENRIASIEAEQVVQNNTLATHTDRLNDHDDKIAANKLNADSRIPKAIEEYNVKPTLSDNDVFLVKQTDGNFKRITARDLYAQAGTQSNLFKGEYASLEALQLAYPDGEDHGFLPGTYATIDDAEKDAFNAVWDNTDMKWVSRDISNFVKEDIYTREQNEQNTAIAAKVSTADIVDNLTSVETTKPLSANQGKEINDRLVYVEENFAELEPTPELEEWDPLLVADGLVDEDGLIHTYEDIIEAVGTGYDDTAVRNLIDTHTADNVKHITEAERTKWNGLSNYDDTAIVAHMADTDKHITTAERTAWNAKLDESAVDAKIAALVDTAPGTLNTLNELAAALGDDPNFSATISMQLGQKVDKVAGSSLVEDTKVADYDTHIADRDIHISDYENTLWTLNAFRHLNLFNPFNYYEIDNNNSINDDGSLVLYNTAPNGTVRIVFVNENGTQVGNSSEVDGEGTPIIAPDGAHAFYLYAGGGTAKYVKYELSALSFFKGLESYFFISANVREINANNIVVDQIIIAHQAVNNDLFQPYPVKTVLKTINGVDLRGGGNIEIGGAEPIDNLASTNASVPLSANMGRELDEAKVDKEAGKGLIETTKVTGYDTHIVDATKHVTTAERTSWNAKLDGSDIVTTLTDNSTTKVASAYNTRTLQLNKVDYADVTDNLTTTTTNKVLSANMGKALNDKIEDFKYWESTLATGVSCAVSWNEAANMVTLRVQITGSNALPAGTYPLPVAINTYRWCHFKAYSNGMQGTPLVWQNAELVVYGDITGGGNPVLCETHFGIKK